MSIEKMLKYQETDMRLIKLENELKNSDCAKKMIAYQSATKKSFDTLTSMNDVAKNNMDTVAKHKTKYEELIKQIDEISKEVMTESDDKQNFLKVSKIWKERLQERAKNFPTRAIDTAKSTSRPPSRRRVTEDIPTNSASSKRKRLSRPTI